MKKLLLISLLLVFSIKILAQGPGTVSGFPFLSDKFATIDLDYGVFCDQTFGIPKDKAYKWIPTKISIKNANKYKDCVVSITSPDKRLNRLKYENLNMVKCNLGEGDVEFCFRDLQGVAVLVLRYDKHRKLLQAVVYFVKGKDRGNYFELTNDKILG